MSLPEIDYPNLTDEELESLKSATTEEERRRQRIAMTPDQVDYLNRGYLIDTGKEPGTAWVQPTGAHDAYPKHWEVTHNGKEWESLISANVWEPGVSGWREVTAGIPAWVQPTGAHDAYAAGAKVSHNGHNWTSNVNANVWEPGVYGWTQNPA